MTPEPPPQLEWLEPWQRLHDSSDVLVRELQKEISPDHVLYGFAVVAVARRADCDDVLFATSNPAMPLAVVHLTWSGCKSFDPERPHTTGYMNWEDWNERCHLPDHREFCRDGSSVRRDFERRQTVPSAFDRQKSLQELEQDEWGDLSNP